MKNHLPAVDMDKLRITLEIKDAYNSGEISLGDARERMRREVVSLKPYEIALAEQLLREFEEDECRKENIQQMLDLFQDVIDLSRPDLQPTHPIMCYYRENDEMRKVLKAIEDLVQYPVIRNQWYEIYDKLGQWKIHLARKQNQLYSVLEKKGFDRPTTTMWLLDDFIRDEIRDARVLLDEGREEEFVAQQLTIVADILDLIQKEETVLLPTSLAMITPEEFEDMKSGDREIGYALIGNVTHESAITVPVDKPQNPEGLAAELVQVLSKYGLTAGGARGQELDVATGKLTLEQINLIYKHLPVDISYVDENELVKFYSDTDHRVFPRSRNVIGRQVKNCHPRTSVHLVEEIIEKFRTGEQDSVDFWINKPGMFIYIYYVAVRDEHGKFRGVLEMMQDCTRIRDLQDSRTLLLWSKDTAGATKYSASAPETESKTGNQPVSAQQEISAVNSEELVIDADTRLQDILRRYPHVKSGLPKVNEAFKVLNTPLARIMIPRATVQMMADRSGMEVDVLIQKLKELTEPK